MNDYERIERAIGYLERNFRNRPDLKAVAEEVNLSEYHFQRLFRRWAGISPKRFIQFLTIEHAKQMLAESRTVLDTTLESGLSSPGRLHDLFVSIDATTPGEYKNDGQSLTISYGFHPTPFGECLVGVTARGVCALEFVSHQDRDELLARLENRWPSAQVKREMRKTKPIVERIFRDANHSFEDKPVHLFVKGTNFQVKVWEALLRIPFGSMCSYDDVARAIGQPNASRAVGSAIGQNAIAYLIPCHRVVRKTGGITNYRWGPTRKKAILGWESAKMDDRES